MRYKATFVTGFAAGYVLGAKAGRARYEQIVKQFRSLMGNADVQQVGETAMHEASDLLGTAKRVVTDRFGGKDVTDQVHSGAVPDLTVRV
jgi:tryptophan synthase beta subunit